MTHDAQKMEHGVEGGVIYSALGVLRFTIQFLTVVLEILCLPIREDLCLLKRESFNGLWRVRN